jgi:ATP-dependent Lon protease
MHLNITLYIKIKQAMSSENLHKMNTRKKDISKKESKTESKKESKKKIETPDIEDSDSESESEGDGGFDMIEYRKFLAKLFPSKYIAQKVKDDQKIPQLIKTESTQITTPDKSNKINIIFTINNKKGDCYDEDYDEDDSDYEDDEDSDDEDSDEYSDEDEDEEEDEDDEEDDEEEESEEEVIVKVQNKKHRKENVVLEIVETGEDDEKNWVDIEETGENDIKISPENIKILKNTPICSVTDPAINNLQFLDILKTMYNQNKSNDSIKTCLEVCKRNMSENIKKEKKLIEKQKQKNAVTFRACLREKNTMNDFAFFCKMDLSDQEKTIKSLQEINKMTQIDKPYRLTLLNSDMPPLFKAEAMKKINSLRNIDPCSGEYYKIKNWVDTFMRIPFGNYKTLPVTLNDGIEACHNFMETAKQTLDTAAFGLNDAKMQIMQMIGQLIANPHAIGSTIAIHGPMGTGKTTLVKEGISKILNRPFAFIALGGATDSCFLEGHSYTYEGSTWGKIVQILVDSKCMNPVIYFDELDKISDTPKGEEIIGILTHLTDSSQNSQFHDKYFAEVDFDLSKCLFIFSYNDESKINPILRDRMYRICTKGYDQKQKTIISNQYLLPSIRNQVKFEEGDIIITEDSLSHIIDKLCNNEDGVRNLKRCLEIIYTKLNLYRLMKPGSNLFEQEMSLNVTFPFTVTKSIVDKLIKNKEENSTFRNMYI